MMPRMASKGGARAEGPMCVIEGMSEDAMHDATDGVELGAARRRKGPP